MDLKGLQQRFRLVQPRGVWRQQTRMPPAAELPQIAWRAVPGMGGVPIVDQVHPLQVPMPSAEVPQRRGVVDRALVCKAYRFHLAAVDDQEHQHTDGAMPGILELALFDRTGDGAAGRPALQYLEVGPPAGATHPPATDGPECSGRRGPQ